MKHEQNFKYWLKIILITALSLVTMTQMVNAQEKETYIIATDTTYAPFEFEDADGNLVGIDMDLLAAIAEDQGFEYEVRVLGFNAAVQALESRLADAVIAGMTITDAREEVFDFSEPYYESGVQFSVASDSDIETLEDLRGKRIAVKMGTMGATYVESIADEYEFEIITFEDSVNMYEDVEVGNSDAAIEDFPVMAYAINTNQVDLRLIDEPQTGGSFGMAVNKGENQELREMFDEGLRNIRASGEYDEIIERYVGAEEIEEEATAERDTSILGQVRENWEQLISGLWVTLWITLVSFAIALIIGIILGLMRTSGVAVLKYIAVFYVDIMRGIPMLVLSFFVYFGLPQFIGVNFSAVTAGIITLSLNAAAYIAENVRAGIQAVDVGQREASESLGLNRFKTMRFIILPQAFRIMIPSFINQFVITLKDTSILSVIGLVELTQTGRIIIARTYQSGSMWVIVGAMYIILITTLTKISNRLEKDI